MDKAEGDIFRNFDLTRFVERMGLRPIEKVILASSIVAAQTKKELASQAVNLIRADFETAFLSLVQGQSIDLSPNQLSKLMTNLLCDVAPDGPVLDSSQRQGLIAATQAKYGSDVISPILHRLLPTMRFV